MSEGRERGRATRLPASFLAGLLGGILAGGATVLLLALGGGFKGADRTVTVQRSPIVASSSPGATRMLTARQVYARDADGVVAVDAVGVTRSPSTRELLKGEAGEEGTASGSGFEVDTRGTILTNWHVVEGATKILVGIGGRQLPAKLIASIPADDIAVLRVPVDGLTLGPLTLGDSSRTAIGDPVLAIGYPFGLGRTLTTGVISALHRRVGRPGGTMLNDALQTDAPINPGNSGGPLVDGAGAVIGINSQIETTAGGSVGIAFAVPIDLAKRELRRLR